MNENIIINEEVIETTEEIATASSGKFFKVAAGIGLAALGSLITYKVVKMIVAKIKNNHQEIDEEPIPIDFEDDETE